MQVHLGVTDRHGDKEQPQQGGGRRGEGGVELMPSGDAVRHQGRSACERRESHCELSATTALGLTPFPRPLGLYPTGVTG